MTETVAVEIVYLNNTLKEIEMAYVKSKDKELKHWEKDGLHVSVHEYDGSEPKVQIGPRVLTTAKGDERFIKPGRLTLEEWDWLTGLDVRSVV